MWRLWGRVEDPESWRHYRRVSHASRLYSGLILPKNTRSEIITYHPPFSVTAESVRPVSTDARRQADGERFPRL